MPDDKIDHSGYLPKAEPEPQWGCLQQQSPMGLENAHPNLEGL
jgi:hypothetical protein